MSRECGDCQLCCKLLPVHDLERPWDRNALNKRAGEKCRHQKFGKGCMVYGKYEMPHCCKLWNCRWLLNTVPGDMSRPDRSHYVVDIMPDFITLKVNEKVSHVEVVQIWCDPKYPDAHRDPALRRWVENLAKQGIVAMVRYNEEESTIIFAPSMSDDGQWHEIKASDPRVTHTRQHSIPEIVEALSKS